MDILNNLSQISNRDTQDALGLAGREPMQLEANVKVENMPNAIPHFEQIIIAGMGGSALAADIARDWLNLPVPLQVVKDYTLPNYVSPKTLVIICSFSGNTEETLSTLANARDRGASVVIATGGGNLLQIAREQSLPYILMPYNGQPRMFMLLNLRSFVEVLIAYRVLSSPIRGEFLAVAEKLKDVEKSWGVKVPYADNLAKKLAWHCTGKIPVIYAGARFRSIAYKWKISFNENSKNIAFCDELPEFNHNEFIGWSSHPIDKPFAVFDLHSSFDHPQVTKRFTVTDRLLSGLRPKSVPIKLEGETMLEQIVWASVLADYVSIYLAILNGVDPAPVLLIENFKKELQNL